MTIKTFFIKLRDFTKRNLPAMAVSFSVLLAISLVTAVAVVGVNKNDNPVVVPTTNITQKEQEEKVEPGTDDKEPIVEPTNAEEPIVFAMPVEGATDGLPFAQDYLVKYPVLGKWQTHEGIDLVALAGTKVVAAYDGKVESIEETGMYGNMIVIDHGNGLKTIYKSLSREIALKAGDVVKKGDQIGTISNSAKAEENLGAHLHFEVMLNNELVDPADYLPDGNK